MSILDKAKTYVIESEKDVPEKYREEIEKRLSSNESAINTDAPDIVPGKKGHTISSQSEIANVFNNSEEIYFGHGTPGGEEIIDSIFKIGLKTVQGEQSYQSTLRGLDSTTIFFGTGSESLYNEQKNQLDNWMHKESKNIIIISIPQKYALRPCEVRNVDFYEAFYVGNKEEGFRIRPEFIKGVYNSDSQSFTPNDNFYKNLDSEQQSKLLENVKNKYIKSYAEYSMISPESVMYPLKLNQSELEQLSIEWYKVQLERFRNDKKFEPQMIDTDLNEILYETRMFDFNNATNLIRADAQQELKSNEKGSLEVTIDEDW